MIVVVLVVIWVIALTPFLLRRLSEHQIASSAERFRSATRLLRRVYPRLAAVNGDGSIVRPEATAHSAAMRRRREIERARRQRARRKELLFRLVGGTGGTIVLGALPHLHFLWDLSIVGAILTTCYVSALYYLAQKPAPLPSMQRPAAPYRSPVTEHTQERVAAAGGAGRFVVAPMQRRPAFVLVDPNS